MNGVLERTLGILELLSARAEPMELGAMADQLAIPRSAVHRLLTDLMRCGYVRQTREHGEYVLTTKLVSLGMSYLSHTGIVDIAQPLLDRLAEISGELVRLSVIDGDRLTWVAKAQGARQGLRYDPDMGQNARLSCSSSGQAWMLAISDEEAVALVSRQGFGTPQEYGPNAPTTIAQLLSSLHAARERGYSMTCETYTAGLNAMAAPVCRPGHAPIGAISIGGPNVRLTPERMHELAPHLLATATELAMASMASPLLQRPSRTAATAMAEPVAAAA